MQHIYCIHLTVLIIVNNLKCFLRDSQKHKPHSYIPDHVIKLYPEFWIENVESTVHCLKTTVLFVLATYKDRNVVWIHARNNVI